MDMRLNRLFRGYVNVCRKHRYLPDRHPRAERVNPPVILRSYIIHGYATEQTLQGLRKRLSQTSILTRPASVRAATKSKWTEERELEDPRDSPIWVVVRLTSRSERAVSVQPRVTKLGKKTMTFKMTWRE